MLTLTCCSSFHRHENKHYNLTIFERETFIEHSYQINCFKMK